MTERFGSYELLEKIGEGGMAEVWKARATGVAGFQKILVVKKILPMFARNKAFVDMLVAEAKLCSLLHHPNIVPIFELGEIDGVYYITMEHVDGVDLLQVLQRAARQQLRVPTEVALFMAAEVSRGLAYAHAAVDQEGRPLNIIHRDVSPANIMVGMRGEVKVMDFGVARADLEIESRRSAAQVVRHDGLKGKLSYMSPELVSGREIDHRSDIFAVGTLLYEMLTLKRLFMGKSEMQTMANVRNARITRRMERHEYIPDAVQGLLRRALARDPEERFQGAQELDDAISDYLFEARLRVGPAQLAQFVAELFPERAPRAASPKVAGKRGRRTDTVQDLGLPAALNAELATRRGARALDAEGEADTVEQESLFAERSFDEDDDEGGADEVAAGGAERVAAPRIRGGRVGVPAVGARPARRRFDPVDPAGVVDALLVALEREVAAVPARLPRVMVDTAGADEDAEDDSPGEDDEVAVAPLPAGASLRIRSDEDDVGFFGPVSVASFEQLAHNRAISDAEEVSIDGGAWMRIALSQIPRLCPELFEEPGRPVYSGRLRAVWLPRLFHQLAQARATGMLQLARGWVRKELHYRAGALVHIQSNIKGELLLAVAQELGAVSRDQVTAALHTAKTLGLPVGEGLISIGALDETRLPAILREQQRRRFRELLGWSEGTFAFFDAVPIPPVVHTEPLDVRAMVGPAVREHTTLEQLRELFRPHHGRALTWRPDPPLPLVALGLAAEELAIVERVVDGAPLGDALGHTATPLHELHLWRGLLLALSFDLMRLGP